MSFIYMVVNYPNDNARYHSYCDGTCAAVSS